MVLGPPLGNETIIIYEPEDEDWHGDRTEEDPEGVTVSGCVLFPRGSAETNDLSNMVITALTLLAPAGTPLTKTCEVQARGRRWKVEGDPGEYIDVQPEAIQAALEAVTG